MKKLLLFLLFVCLKQVNAQNIFTYAGNGGSGFSGDGGQAAMAQIDPWSVAVNSSSEVYITDRSNNRIRKVSSLGVITTFAGNGTSGFSGDGGAATSAQISAPYGVAVDGFGNVYIADDGNSCIRKINTSGIISTIAGTGVVGYSGDGGPAISATLNYPTNIAIDGAGNIYIADNGNNCIRKINTSGIISTIAGTGVSGFSGDGGAATSAQISGGFNVHTQIAIDGAGNIYISDYDNNRIRKINTSNVINTIAGTGIAGFSGDGGIATSAQIKTPAGIAVDASGNIYFSEYYSSRIRKINTSGIITTFAGNGITGFSGDGGLAVSAQLGSPIACAIDISNNLYFAERQNMRVRIICPSNCLAGFNNILVSNQNIQIYPNPTSDQFFIDANTTDKLTVDLYDVNGRLVFSKNVSDKTNINVTTLKDGIYTMTIKTVDRVINKKLVVIR